MQLFPFLGVLICLTLYICRLCYQVSINFRLLHFYLAMTSYLQEMCLFFFFLKCTFLTQLLCLPFKSIGLNVSRVHISFLLVSVHIIYPWLVSAFKLSESLLLAVYSGIEKISCLRVFLIGALKHLYLKTYGAFGFIYIIYYFFSLCPICFYSSSPSFLD